MVIWWNRNDFEDLIAKNFLKLINRQGTDWESSMTPKQINKKSAHWGTSVLKIKVFKVARSEKKTMFKWATTRQLTFQRKQLKRM